MLIHGDGKRVYDHHGARQYDEQWKSEIGNRVRMR